MLVVCERWVGDGDRLLYWPSSTSFSSWLGCSTVGHWGPKALCLPLALHSASCLQLTQVICALVILLFNTHLLLLFFRLFTQVHLLIDGSAESQYVTLRPPCLTLSILSYISRVKWSNPGKGVAPSPTPRCSSYWKGSLQVANFTYHTSVIYKHWIK